MAFHNQILNTEPNFSLIGDDHPALDLLKKILEKDPDKRI